MILIITAFFIFATLYLLNYELVDTFSPLNDDYTKYQAMEWLLVCFLTFVECLLVLVGCKKLTINITFNQKSISD